MAKKNPASVKKAREPRARASKDEVYEIPMALSLALTTNRVQFLNQLSDEDLGKEDVRRLLHDLIEDRVVMQQQLVSAVEGVKQTVKQLDAAYLKIAALRDILDGSRETLSTLVGQDSEDEGEED